MIVAPPKPHRHTQAMRRVEAEHGIPLHVLLTGYLHQGMTQGKMAKLLEVDPSTESRWFYRLGL